MIETTRLDPGQYELLLMQGTGQQNCMIVRYARPAPAFRFRGTALVVFRQSSEATRRSLHLATVLGVPRTVPRSRSAPRLLFYVLLNATRCGKHLKQQHTSWVLNTSQSCEKGSRNVDYLFRIEITIAEMNFDVLAIQAYLQLINQSPHKKCLRL